MCNKTCHRWQERTREGKSRKGDPRMKKKAWTVLTIAATVTAITAAVMVIVHLKKSGYVSPLDITYSFVYE
jgi:flagellar basal body-associated protein FliL